MLIKKIGVLGGAGFVGHTLANHLSDAGYQVKILTRSRETHKKNLILLPELELIETDIHNQANLDHHLSDCDAIINLVGILNEKGRKGTGFEYAHVELVNKIIHSCQKNGIKRVLQMSALNADAEKGSSFYLRSKGIAEQLLLSQADLNVSCYRPSVIFGPGDDFFNRFATLLKLTPLIFPLACPHAKFAPVYVEDVVTAMLGTLQDPDSYGKHYCLCGPSVYSLQQLVQYTAGCTGVKRHILPLNDVLSRFQAAMFDFVPGKPFSTDNYLSTKKDSVCDENDLVRFGIKPTPLEAVVPQYLSNRHQRAYYGNYREKAHR